MTPLQPTRLHATPASLPLARRESGGIIELTLDPPADGLLADGLVGVIWYMPVTDIVGMWNPGLYRDRSLRADWSAGMHANATVNAPVVCLFSAGGDNRMTIACSEALQPVEVFAGIVEETGEMRCEVRLLRPAETFQTGPVTIRLDIRRIPWSRALGEVADWWTTMPRHRPAAVPDVARQPMYSTWYSFHQAMTADAIIEQCALARDYGCQAVIVDDGWQTDDAQKGYSYCGDWESAGSKLGDLRDFTRRVHDLGMKALLWYALPWVGPNSQAWKRFSKMTLRDVPPMQASVLDPRYPAVREHLIETAVRAIRDWDLDGLKLDFVDRWHDDGGVPPKNAAMDHASVFDAADRVLSDLMASLRAIKPEVMIEFRQRYIGPLMRKYGNLFRAGDCPADAVQNRVRTIDVRLLAGETATHSDMLMWHADEPVESAARQLLNVLFSVPQISVRLDRIPESHQRMLRFWLGVWKEHRAVLLDGALSPSGPELLYPVIRADKDDKAVIAVYGDAVVSLGADLPKELLIVNATAGDRVILESQSDQGMVACQAFTATGEPVHEGTASIHRGVQPLAVPPSGLLCLSHIPRAG